MTARRVALTRRGARRLAGAALALPMLLVAPSLAAAQDLTPPLSAGRVLGEALGGTYAGIGGFVVGRYLGERVSDAVGVQADRTRDRVAMISGITLAGLATAGTVYAIGNIDGQTGDFDRTWLGSGIGFAAAFAINYVIIGPLERPREGTSTATQWIVANALAFLPSIGATIAFNQTRRYR